MQCGTFWSNVYRILKEHELITSTAFLVRQAINEYKDKTTGVNQQWQIDFTYLKVILRRCYFLGTALNDFFRFIVGWELSPQVPRISGQLYAPIFPMEAQNKY